MKEPFQLFFGSSVNGGARGRSSRIRFEVDICMNDVHVKNITILKMGGNPSISLFN